MALFVRQTEERSKLQERLAAELQNKLRQQPLEQDDGDKLEDSSYLKETRTTGPFAVLWIVVAGLALVVIGVSVFMITT